MFLVRVPNCQQSVHVVAEYTLECTLKNGKPFGQWEVTSTETSACGQGDTLDEAVSRFAQDFNNSFNEPTL